MLICRNEWKADIHFQDGWEVEKADKVLYLGGATAAQASKNAEIASRMTKAVGTCQKLEISRRKTNASTAWKLRVYSASIIAQLVYGLNTLNITPGIKNRVSAFHIRGLRYIPNIEHSYYSRATNEEIMHKANLM